MILDAKMDSNWERQNEKEEEVCICKDMSIRENLPCPVHNKPEEYIKKDFRPDSIVQTIINRFIERAKMGKQKYGTDLDRTDLSIVDYLEHAQQEHMDAILYLEKAKQMIINGQKEKGATY